MIWYMAAFRSKNLECTFILDDSFGIWQPRLRDSQLLWCAFLPREEFHQGLLCIEPRCWTSLAPHITWAKGRVLYHSITPVRKVLYCRCAMFLLREASVVVSMVLFNVAFSSKCESVIHPQSRVGRSKSELRTPRCIWFLLTISSLATELGIFDIWVIGGAMARVNIPYSPWQERSDFTLVWTFWVMSRQPL